MRIIDLHCYPNTEPWIRSQGPYVEALAKYWKRAWTWKSEAEVIEEFKQAAVEAVLVAFDIESVTGSMRDAHPGVILQAWGAVDPLKGDRAIEDAKEAIEKHKLFGFHFHPIMGHYSVDERRLYPLWETINALRVPVMIDVGTTGMGAGMPGGLGAVIRHAHPAAIDRLAADFPDLNVVAAHPGWPWTDEMLAVALHKGNVSWELSGWAPKYFPDALKRDIKGRLQDKIMFGSDYPSLPYERIFKEWRELNYSDELMEKIYHRNAERILSL
jgi:predicted TIM-barrel fold metal-dependent hydrolase